MARDNVRTTAITELAAIVADHQRSGISSEHSKRPYDG